MINLEVENYCDNCMNFKADVHINVTKTLANPDGEVYTRIMCENRGTCKSIYDHIKKEMKE